jgi:hypothetical protein
MYRIVPFLFLFILGCASGSSRPDAVARPDIDSSLAHPISFGAGTVATVTIDVTVRNNAAVPLLVHRIEIDSPGMARYSLVPIRRALNETLAPGEIRAIPILTNAVTTTSRPGEPLSIRTILEFEAQGRRWREVTMTRDPNALQ